MTGVQTCALPISYDSADQTFDALIEKLMSGSDAFIGEDPVDAYCGLWDTHR